MFGKTRQAFYKKQKRIESQQLQANVVIDLVNKKRKNKKRTGTRKLYHELRHDFITHNIKLGRDGLFAILREHKMLIKKRKRGVRTTQSYHWLRKYPNQIIDFKVNKACELWVSDITYIRIAQAFGYLFLITDAYSRKIVGWYLSNNLLTINAVKALEMALENEEITEKLIHHSDRGVQYCSKEYVIILNKSQIKISMTENSDPRENAIAERVNGILKDEWINDLSFLNMKEAQMRIGEIIYTYNHERLHQSIDYMTPVEAHVKTSDIPQKWKNHKKIKALAFVSAKQS